MPSRPVLAEHGFVTVWDTEVGDCNPADGVPGDFDGDLDAGLGGGAFGHGTWAEHCGFHVETAGSVTVTDFVFGSTVAFMLGSNDANGFLFDPETGENTCITDGVISPGTDLEGDDCLSASGTGTQPIFCPGGGDGVIIIVIIVKPSPCPSDPLGLTCPEPYNPPTMGTITSP